MKANFSKMKEQIRSTDADLAGKLDAFEQKMEAAIQSGSDPMSAAKQIGKELVLPDPSEGGFKMGMGGPKKKDADQATTLQFNNYSSRGFTVQNSAIQGLLDALA